MQPPDDSALLRQYTQQGSEAAFAALVTRHVSLVYSVALRRVGHPQNAQEITQAVFIILAKKAAQLRHDQALSSWLFQVTRLTASNFVRSESRRHHREQETHMQSLANESAHEPWPEIAPLLDDAVARLRDRDRHAIVLRFYEGRNLREVGLALGASEDAAEKRVNRALEKLRKFFVQRGVVSTTTVIAGVISAHSVQAAPATLASAAAAAALAQGVTASTLTLIKATLKLMAWTKAKIAVVVGLSLLSATVITSVVVSHIGGRDREARELLDKVRHKYASLSSYSSTGTTVEGIDNKTLTASFTMRLGRTNLYLVEYEQHAPTFTNKGAAWSDGTGEYFANDVAAQTTKLPEFGTAQNLGNISDVTGGATIIVPEMFLGIQTPGTSTEGIGGLFHAANLAKTRITKEADEKVSETDCCVLSWKSDAGKLRLWVGKDDFLVHQSQEWLISKLPEATDSEVKQILAAVPGAPPLPLVEMKRRINQAREKARATLQPVTVIFSEDKGKSGLKSMTVPPPAIFQYTQKNDNIGVNQKFGPSDFVRHPVISSPK